MAKRHLIVVKKIVFTLICITILKNKGLTQTSNLIFNDDFENTFISTANWGSGGNYTITSGNTGNGLHISNTSTTNAVFLTKTISIDSVRGRTIAFSAKVKGQNIVSTQPFLGMKVMLTLAYSTKTISPQLEAQTGTFNWKDLGYYIVIDSTITSLNLTLGIQQATGDLWFDDVKIEVVDNKSKMPPARNPNLPINKCHNLGMSRGMNVDVAHPKWSLDQLSYDWKADHIRVQMTLPPSLLATNYSSLLSNSFTKIDSMAKWCKVNKLKMIIDAHALADGLFSSKNAQSLFINTWKQIATRYKNDSAIWAYDLVNEPFYYNYGWPNNDGYLMYNNLMDTLVREIRKIDTLRPIMIECLASDLSFANFRPVDFSIPNIIYSFHFYEPSKFTHQTLYGNTIKYAFPGIIDGKYYDKNVLKSLMQPIKDFQDKYRVPIYVGEFSAIRWAKNCTAYNYIRDCIEIFEEYNWDWSYHAFREYHGWSVEHSCDSSEVGYAAEPTSSEDLIRNYFAKKQVGVKTNYFDNSNYSVYPIPTENKITIEFKNKKTGIIQLQLINYNGQILISETVTNNFLKKELNLESFPKGIYFLRINSESNTSGKIIILK